MHLLRFTAIIYKERVFILTKIKFTNGTVCREKFSVHTSKKWSHTATKPGYLKNSARTQNTSQPTLPGTNSMRFLGNYRRNGCECLFLHKIKLNSMYYILKVPLFSLILLKVSLNPEELLPFPSFKCFFSSSKTSSMSKHMDCEALTSKAKQKPGPSLCVH